MKKRKINRLLVFFMCFIFLLITSILHDKFIGFRSEPYTWNKIINNLPFVSVFYMFASVVVAWLYGDNIIQFFAELFSKSRNMNKK